MPPVPEIRVLADADALARSAAEEFRRVVKDAVRDRGVASVALSGGSTPRRLYALLANGAAGPPIPWDRIHFFFGDERHVPPDDPESNFHMASESMLSKSPVPPANVHRIRSEDPDGESAASAYEQDLSLHFRLGPNQFPQFDLTLLGLGADGHTASLFPGTKALSETVRLAVSNWVGKLDTIRITLTAPVFNHASCVIFLVAGEDKAMPLKSVLRGPFEPAQLPAQLIRPDAGRLLWLVDRAAASRLGAAGSAP